MYYIVQFGGGKMELKKILVVLLLAFFLCSLQVEANTKTDAYLLAKIICGEAQTETFHGKLAVGTVVLNRVEDFRFPDTIEEVIYAPNQFTVTKQEKWKNIEPDKDSWRAARKILNGYRSFRSSILFYYNPKIATDKKFVESVEPILTIRNHIFAQHKK